MRPAEAVRFSADYLAGKGLDSPRACAEVLVMHLLRVDRVGLYARKEPLDERSCGSLRAALSRVGRGTPLQYVTGKQQFMDLSLAVEPGVFIPRPETELLAVAACEALPSVPSPVVVDVGTGTGAVALVLKRLRPDARVMATDMSPKAVRCAANNASVHGLTVTVLQGDLLEPLPEACRGTVDLIVSNPPYVEPQEFPTLPADVRAQPYEALVGGTALHRRLARAAPRWLAPGGWLVMEIGASQAAEVRGILQPDYSSVEVTKDLAGRDRIVRARFDPHDRGL